MGGTVWFRFRGKEEGEDTEILLEGGEDGERSEGRDEGGRKKIRGSEPLGREAKEDPWEIQLADYEEVGKAGREGFGRGKAAPKKGFHCTVEVFVTVLLL